MSLVRRIFPEPDQREASFLGELFRREAVGGAIALVAAVVAIVWANSAWAASYLELRHLDIGPLDVEHWAADGALTLFFFVAGPGAEARVGGRLAAAAGRRGRAGAAAVCGVAVPALLYLAINANGGHPRGLGGAGGDGHRVRAGRAGRRGLQPAHGAAGVPADAGRGGRPDRDPDHRACSSPTRSTSSGWPSRWRPWSRGRSCSGAGVDARVYVPLAVLAWWAVHECGVHATIAGVALGLLTRVRRDPGEEPAPAEHLEHVLSPVSSALAVPFFALMSAGVVLAGGAELVRDPVVVGVVVGLVVGKPVGVFAGGWLVARFTRAELTRRSAGGTWSASPCSPASGSPCRCWSPTCRSRRSGTPPRPPPPGRPSRPSSVRWSSATVTASGLLPARSADRTERPGVDVWDQSTQRVSRRQSSADPRLPCP